MAEIDYEEAIKLCRQVKADLEDLFEAVRGRAFYDIGYDIGNVARSGLGYEHMMPELDQLEECLHKRCPDSFNDTHARIYDLVNFYDHLIGLVHSQKEHYRKGEHMHSQLMEWRGRASRLAQVVSCLDDD